MSTLGSIPLRRLIKVADGGRASDEVNRALGFPDPSPFVRNPRMTRPAGSNAAVADQAQIYRDGGMPPPSFLPERAVGAPDPSMLARANYARQLARNASAQGTFRGTVNQGNFTDAAAAQRFLNNNKGFASQAQQMMAGGRTQAPVYRAPSAAAPTKSTPATPPALPRAMLGDMKLRGPATQGDGTVDYFSAMAPARTRKTPGADLPQSLGGPAQPPTLLSQKLRNPLADPKIQDGIDRVRSVQGLPSRGFATQTRTNPFGITALNPNSSGSSASAPAGATPPAPNPAPNLQLREPSLTGGLGLGGWANRLPPRLLSGTGG